jgi:hypothetical protein
MTKKTQKKQARRRAIPWIAAGTASGAVLLGMGVQAQEQGRLATFGLSFGGQYTADDPNAAPDATRLTTGLSFGLSSVTPRGRSFGLFANGDIQLDEEGLSFARPGIFVDYALVNRSTALNFDASFREQDVDGNFTQFDPLDPLSVDFIQDDGTRQTLRLAAGLQTGLDAPFGTDTLLSYNGRRFVDTSDPSLTDLDIFLFITSLRFEINPLFTLRTTASYEQSDEVGGENTDRDTARVGIGAVLALDQLWSAAVDLNYSRIDNESDNGLGGRDFTQTEGIGFVFGIDRQFRTGTLGFSLEREITENGPNDSFRVRRDREFSNGTVLDWSLGLISFDGEEISPIGSLAYSTATPRGNFSVNLVQSTAVDEDDRTTLNTSLGIDYTREINTTSSWSLNGALGSINYINNDTEDELSTVIGLGYNHALTRDWDLVTSLSHRVNYVGSDIDDTASILSFSLERSFSFRP